MRKILTYLTLLTLSLGVVAGPACIFKPSLVGKWQNVQENNQYIEFIKDGNVVFDNGTIRVTGTYELVGDEYIKVDLEGLAGGLLNLVAANTWKYEISGNLMTLQIGDQTTTFKRVKS